MAFKTAAAALLLIAVSVSASDAVSPMEALKDVEMASSFRIDEQSHGRDLGFFDFGFNWNMLMFDLGMCPCGPGPWMGPLCPVDGYCNVKGPAGQAHDDHSFQHLQRIMADCGCCVGTDESGNCCASIDGDGNCLDASGEVVGTAAASDESSTQTSSEGSRSVGGASVKSNWWMYVVGAATVGLVGAAIVMRKRRNAEAEAGLEGEASLSGAVSRRASLLAGGAAAGAAAGAAMPAFLSVPSFRRSPSGLEVGADGAIIEQSPSNYMDMDNHVDPSQLPDGVEVSPSGNLEPYHSGSMA